ncbi:MAG: hypothetical protein KC933_06245 [Myxococcales bacterium]|nr:hypothetical protein [Myxococcales bacterium]
MDVFAWLDAVNGTLLELGEHRLVDGVFRLSSLIHNDQHDAVDALVPELLTDLQRVRHPWLEVYVRHWALQSRILRRADVARGLDDAVYLVDFASQEETRDCPQSICAVQDLAAAYGYADGAGYAEERLAVTRETLDRIDATWPCFDCLSVEHADALVRAGRPEDAVEFVEAQTATAQRTGGNWAEMTDVRIDALLALGRNDEALALTGPRVPCWTGRAFVLRRRLNRARALTRLGRPDEAVKLLPDFETEILPTPVLYESWLALVEDLVERALEGGPENDGHLDRTIAALAQKLEGNGALRRCFETTEARLRLALARGRADVAAHVLDDLRRRAALLQRPLDAPARVEAAASRVAEAPAPAPPVIGASVEETMQAISEDPEVAWDQVLAAAERWPTSVDLATALAGLAWSPPTVAVAISRVEAMASAASAPDRLQQILGHLLLTHAPERLETWAEALLPRGGALAATAHWVRGRHAWAHGDHATARACFEAVLALDATAKNAPKALVALLEEMGDLEAALGALDEAKRRADEDDRPAYDWRRMMLATRLGDWPLVRAICAELGLELETTEGPIDEVWGRIEVRLSPPLVEGGPVVLEAVRTGPATARVNEIAASDEPNWYDAALIIDPFPLREDPDAALDEDDEESEERPMIHAAVEVLRRPESLIVELVGARPEAQVLDALVERLLELGAAIRMATGTWDIEHAETEESRPGFGWLIALPEGTDLRAAHTALEEAARAVDGVMVWPELVARLEEPEPIEAQEAIAAAWRLD